MLTTVMERVASAIAPRKRNTAATLQESLGKLRGCVDEIARREKFIDEATQLISERIKIYGLIGSALDIALKGDNIDKVKAALDLLDGKTNHVELLQSHVKALVRASATRSHRDSYLKAHYADALNALQTTCGLQLEQAEADLERVTKEEQQRLDALGEDYDAASSPVVKRIAARVAQLQGMQKSIESQTRDGFLLVFVNFAENLLSRE